MGSNYTTKTAEVGSALSIQITADSNHASAKRFAGFSVRESAGTAAEAAVNFRHGSATGDLLAVVELAADGSETVSLPFAVDTPDGVHVEVVSGTVEGSIYARSE